MGMSRSPEEEIQRIIAAGEKGEVRPEKVERQIARVLQQSRLAGTAVTRTGNRLTIRVRGATIRHTTKRPERVPGERPVARRKAK